MKHNCHYIYIIHIIQNSEVPYLMTDEATIRNGSSGNEGDTR